MRAWRKGALARATEDVNFPVAGQFSETGAQLLQWDVDRTWARLHRQGFDLSSNLRSRRRAQCAAGHAAPMMTLMLAYSYRWIHCV